MNVKFKKVIACILVVVFSLVTFSPAYAGVDMAKDQPVNQFSTVEKIFVNDNQAMGESNQMSPYGLKKTAVVNALKYGGALLADIVDLIGDKAIAQMLRDNAYAIGVFLEGITDSFEANLIQFLWVELGLPIYAARNIAWAISIILL